MLRQCIAFGLMVGSLLLGTDTTQACGLDGIPSMLIDGRLVEVNHVPPAPGHLSTWAPFSAPGVYLPGRLLQFGEIRGRVLWTLPPSAFKTPWRWTFGDGAQARGMIVHHDYRRAGTYVVGVRADLIDGKDSQWYLFDTMVIHIR
jgi:PKD domain